MSRPLIPLTTPDISAFARTLSRQLSAAEGTPSHLALMNMLARSAGYRNFQHMRAAHAAEARLVPQPALPTDHRLVERALQHFDAAGRLLRWPGRRQVRTLCLQALWARLPAASTMTEGQVNAALSALHSFDDVAQLRRGLVEDRLMTRNRDGSDYRRVEAAPGPEALALIRLLAARAGQTHG